MTEPQAALRSEAAPEAAGPQAERSQSRAAADEQRQGAARSVRQRVDTEIHVRQALRMEGGEERGGGSRDRAIT